MYSILKSNLGRRILLLVTVSTLLVLANLAISGWLAVRQSTQRVLHERQALAQATGSYLDYVLRQNLRSLDSINYAAGVDVEDSDLEPEKRALHSLYLASIFDGGVFITDQNGTVLWSEPFSQDFVGSNISNYPSILQSLADKKPTISNIITIGPDSEEAVFMASPLRNREGRIVGLVGGRIDPSGRALQDFVHTVNLGETSHIDIIDGNGVVLASSDPSRVLKLDSEISRQGEAEVSESSLLTTAPWSVAVRQAASEALAPVRSMGQRFIIFGLASLFIALFLGWGMARSMVRPISRLTTAAQRISQGNLSQPIPPLGSDEIGELSRSFDTMRVELKRLLDEIQEWNRALEAKVEERTRQLEASYREIERKEAARGELLRKVLSAQEEERKRIARELHDETSQSLVGLVMRLEAAMAIPGMADGNLRDKLSDIKALAVRTIDNVHKIIFDLRPSVLDDLGLLSALRWYASNRLENLGIKTRIEVTGEEIKLPPQIEIALFRITQEALNNIARHARAQNVVLSVEYKDSSIRIEVEDDGIGFDVDAVSLKPDKVQGVGLLGMKERIMLLGGDFDIESQPGGGTRLTVEVNLARG
ncbi:MAG: HAMP domain-containing protein [Chloroflexota bacterium]